MRGMTIVPMEERHLDDLARLERLCFSRPWSRQALKEELTNPAACFLVGEEAGEVLGYAGMHCAAGECYVDNVAVFPEARRQGVGRKLMEALLQAAAARGVHCTALGDYRQGPVPADAPDAAVPAAVLGYAGLSEGQIGPAVDALADAWGAWLPGAGG